MANDNFIYGIHTIETLLHKRAHQILEIFIQQNRSIQSITQLAKENDIAVHLMDKKQLDKKVGSVAHQGVIARIRSSQALNENDLWNLLDKLKESPFLLILDQVQDPHNLGACLRSANAFGVQAVIVPKDNAVGLTPAVCKVASGAAETVPFVQVANISRVMRELKKRDIWLIGADNNAKQNLHEADLPKSIAIVMGAEGKGLRRLTKENCDLLLKIPMQGVIESLNVSVATGIFLFSLRHS